MSHQAMEMVEVEDAAVENNTAGSVASSTGGDQLGSMTKRELSTRSTSSPKKSNEAGPSDDDAVISCPGRLRHEVGKKASSPTIFSFPRSIIRVDPRAQEPEIVSIGPYYRGLRHLRGFQRHKWFFLLRFLDRSKATAESLTKYLAEQENIVRSHYSEPIDMTSDKFLKMMLLDCCFVLELLQDPKSDGAPDEGNPIATEPWIRPIVTRDLLKLGNQVPFFILKGLSSMSLGRKDELDDNLRASALKFFSRVYERSPEAEKNCIAKPHHLLHLYYSTLLPENPRERENSQKCRPSDPSIPCVTKLWSSGIKFKSKETGKFLEISFRKRVLEIPSITINDFMANMLIQCLALEQRWDNDSKHITDYVFFMYCLINQPEDASLLCSNGIIARSSHNDQYVASLFNRLGNEIIFNVRECYLSKQLDELKTYYNNNWAYILRTYFSSPWSIIAVFSAFLGIALTVIQTVYTVLGYPSH